MSDQQWRPWSPLEIEEKLHTIVHRLNDAVGVFYKTSMDFGAAKADYELAFSRAMLKAKTERTDEGKPVFTAEADRKAWATVECDEEFRTFKIAEAKHDAQRRIIDVLKAEGEILRTLLVQSRGVQDPRR